MVAYFSLSGKGRVVRCGWALIRGWVFINFFCLYRMGAYSRWALIRGWAFIRINTVSFLACYGFLSFYINYVHSPLPIPMIVATANEKN